LNHVPIDASGQKLSVLMPAHNEAATLEAIVQRVLASEPGLPIELVIVDDGSTDAGPEIIERLAAGDERIRCIRHNTSRGKGAAVRTAIAAATGTIAIVQDADFEYDPADYAKVLAPILDGSADAVYGSRFAAGTPPGCLKQSVLANRFLTWLSNRLNGMELTDMETCYKALRIEVLRSLRLTADRFGIEPEITAELARARVSILEVPISYHPRSYAEGKKIKWRDGLAAIGHIIRFRFRKG
jgi:glycosyltransferase involved in cell wall biosynthesis